MNIYVGQLTLDTTEDELREVFAAFGEVQSVRIVRERPDVDDAESVGYMIAPPIVRHSLPPSGAGTGRM